MSRGRLVASLAISAVLHAAVLGAGALLVARGELPRLLVELADGTAGDPGTRSAPAPAAAAPAAPARAAPAPAPAASAPSAGRRGPVVAERKPVRPAAGASEASRETRRLAGRSTVAERPPEPALELPPAPPPALAPVEPPLDVRLPEEARHPSPPPPRPPDRASVEPPRDAPVAAPPERGASADEPGPPAVPRGAAPVAARDAGSGGGRPGPLAGPRAGQGERPVAGGSGEGGGPALARTTAAPEIASAYGPYLVEFRRRIQAGLRYPPAARRRGLAGTAEIDVLVDARGRIERVEIHRSSTHAALDEAALDAVKRATPPPLPPGAPARPLRLRLPVVFELR